MQKIEQTRIIEDASNLTFSYNIARLDTKPTSNKAINFKELVSLIQSGASRHAAEHYQQIEKAAKRFYEHGDHRAKPDMDRVKKSLAWFQPAGFNSFGHGATGLLPNGLIQLDIDFHYSNGNSKALRLKNKIAQLPYVALCATSPSTYGLKVLIKTDIAPDAMTDEIYQFAQKQLIKKFSILFDVEEKDFDKFSIAQCCYLPFDPSVFHNENAATYDVDLNLFAVKQPQSSRNTASIISDDEVSQAAKYLIENQICIANCRDEYLSFLAACKNAFGEEGKGIAFEILSFSEAFNVSEFRAKFDYNFESLKRQTGVKADKGTILHHAKQNGFFYNTPISIAPIKDFTPRLIVSEKPQVTFVEFVNGDMNAAYYETAQKVTRQIKNQNLVPKMGFASDSTKTLYVLFDHNVKELPEYFKGFKETVFVMAAKGKEVLSMSDFVGYSDRAVNSFLDMVDNGLYGNYFERMFYETIKKQILPIKKSGDKWAKCKETATKLENEHHVLVLANNQSKMAAYLKKYTNDLDVVNCDLSDLSEIIEKDIKETGIQLTKEKKQEFEEFFEAIETIENFDFEAFNNLPYTTLERGGKVAYKRIKILLKLNVDFNTALDAVRDSYQTWGRTKGQFATSKEMDSKTKNAKNLNNFKSEVEGQLLRKEEILQHAFELNYISKNEKNAWNELKRMFVITSKKVQTNNNRERVYELHFFKCVQKSLI